MIGVEMEQSAGKRMSEVKEVIVTIKRIVCVLRDDVCVVQIRDSHEGIGRAISDKRLIVECNWGRKGLNDLLPEG